MANERLDWLLEAEPYSRYRKDHHDIMRTSNDYDAADIPIACTLTDAERAKRGDEIARTLLLGRQETRELPDGYALRFPGDDTWPPRLVEFIVGERACCAFFSFELVFEHQHGPVWLHLRGPDGTKEFVAQMLMLDAEHHNPK